MKNLKLFITEDNILTTKDLEFIQNSLLSETFLESERLRKQMGSQLNNNGALKYEELKALQEYKCAGNPIVLNLIGICNNMTEKSGFDIEVVEPVLVFKVESNYSSVGVEIYKDMEHTDIKVATLSDVKRLVKIYKEAFGNIKVVNNRLIYGNFVELTDTIAENLSNIEFECLGDIGMLYSLIELGYNTEFNRSNLIMYPLLGITEPLRIY